jgi:tRNA G18 (ribose-2'-O)-methylase SpoU
MQCNPNDPQLNLFRDLRHAQNLHTASNVFLTDGEKITLSILESGLKVISILLTEKLFQQHQELIRKNIADENILIMAKKEMDVLVGINLHSPMMCIANIPENSDISSLHSPIIALNGIVNSDNVGGIIRNAIGLGYESIIYDSETSSPYLRRAVRVSMGSIAYARCVRTQHLKQELLKLKAEKGLTIISAEILPNSISVNEMEFPKDCIIVFGSEGKGVDDDILAISDHIIHIPMNSLVKSLNVSSSSAIILHRASQRNQHCG